jgi:hypothetical protein
LKKDVFLDVATCRNCVKAVSEERIASIFRVENKKKSASEPAEQNPEDGGNTFLRNGG